MRKRQRFAFFAIGGLGLIAAIAPGLAAGISIPDTAADRPAAGQGEVAVQGFEVTDINWTVSDAGEVTEVTFTILRDSDTDPTSSVDASNATVRVLLNDDDGGAGPFNTTWSDCTLPGDGITTGAAVCDTTGVTMQANEMVKVEVLAFDSINR